MEAKKNIINEAKQILDKSLESYQKKNEKYYNDVLIFLNLLFNEEAKSILKINIKKITLNEDIFNMYNKIVNQYKLGKDIFDIENFDLEDFHDFDDIIEIAKTMCNNLLARLNYSFISINVDKSKKYKIISKKNIF